MSESRVYNIHKLNGENYELWRRQMEIYMAENKLKTYILGTNRRPLTDTTDWDEKDAEAQAFIMRGIELDQLRYLSDCITAAEMWSKLKAVHAEKSDQSTQVLLEKFINSKMAEGEIMADYIARVMSMAGRLKDMDLEQKPAMIIAKILSSLPEKYDNVRTSWYAVSRNEQTLERLTDHLINEESLIKIRNGSECADKTAFIIHGKKKHNYKSHVQSQNQSQSHIQGQSQSHIQGQSQSKGYFKRSGTCNYCNKLGHWARECYKKKNDQINKSQNIHRNNTYVCRNYSLYSAM